LIPIAAPPAPPTVAATAFPVDPYEGLALPPASSLPDVIDRGMVSAAIATITAKVAACGATSVHGRVKVRAVVAASGRIGEVSLDGNPDGELHDCITLVVRSLQLPTTQHGGRFASSFVF
jgi:hypothetical protein